MNSIKIILAAIFFYTAPTARAAFYTGSDLHGQDLVLSDSDTLSGVFMNVGLFRIPSGATVFVAPQVNLAIYAATISIQGSLNGIGSGQPGGAGDSRGASQQGNHHDNPHNARFHCWPRTV